MNKTETISVRIPSDIKRHFYKKCDDYGGHTKVMRELVEAFIDNRLTIQPNRHTGLQKLYDDFNSGKED